MTASMLPRRWRRSMTLMRLEDRTLPSNGLDYDPTRLGPAPINQPLLTHLPEGIADTGLGFGAEQFPVQPAFDSTGKALLSNKSRFNHDLLRLYDDWQLNGSSWTAHPFQGSELLQVDAHGNVEVNLTARDVISLQPGLERAGFHVLYAVPERHVIEGFIRVTSLPNLEPLSALGLMGVDATYRPQTA